ncbi:MAG: hypothetical protein HY847_03135 [Betaproteobacteria bacterium]|nr:hypothetical protein [Betaproteobacteria bacterium]
MITSPQFTPPHTIELPEGGMKRLRPLFQQGIQVRVRDGTSLSEFLQDGLGVDPDYVRKRITTVFLDGSVVDDMDTARLHEGAVLALSAAMPGLVGATMRKGGYYAAMRGDITLGAEQGATETRGQMVQVRVKLFNLLIEEVGPLLLENGFALAPAEAQEFFGEQCPGLSAGSPDIWVRVLAR